MNNPFFSMVTVVRAWLRAFGRDKVIEAVAQATVVECDHTWEMSGFKATTGADPLVALKCSQCHKQMYVEWDVYATGKYDKV